MVKPLGHWLRILFFARSQITLRGLSGFWGIGFRITLRVLSGFQVPLVLIVPSEGGIEVEAGVHVDIILLCQAPERSKENDPLTGRAHERRELDNMQLGLHPPPSRHLP